LLWHFAVVVGSAGVAALAVVVVVELGAGAEARGRCALGSVCDAV